jgi:hypothetical protein
MKNLYLLLFICITSMLYANNDKYRLIVNSDPSTSVTIAWNQIDGVNPVVYYGTTDFGTTYTSYPNSKFVDRSVSRKGMNNQFVRLTGLTPNTAYYFVINDSNSTSARFWFKTAPADNSRLSFIAGGDSRNNRTPRQAANSLVAKLKPNAILFGGDMTNTNSNIEWQDWFDDWQLTTASDGRMFPIIATRGNHENETTVVYDLFDTPDANSYYGVTFGDDLFHIITLNTELAPAGDQKTWLEAELAAHSNATWKSVQYHRPMRPHTASKAEGIDRYNAWAQLFFDEGVQLVFESDSHTVKNTWPIEPSSGPGSSEGFIRNDNNGTVYTGEGCWGAPTRDADDNKPWTRNSGKFNQFKLVFVDENSIELRTIKVDNAASVGEVDNSDPFTLPTNLDVWNPSNGEVVIISNEERSQIDFADNTPTNFNSNITETVSINVIDEGPGITEVAFYIDNTWVATDDTAPYQLSHMFPVGYHHLQARATDINGVIAYANLNFRAGSFTDTDTVFINSGDNDAEQRQDGSVSFSSSDLELIYDSGTSGALQTIGLRFEDLNIPVGATITNAYIQFSSDHDSANDTVNLQISAEDSSNPASFEDTTNNISSRSRVSGSVPWSPVQWNNNDRGNDQRTPGLDGLLQQIINRCDWTEGDDVVFIIEGSDMTYRRVDSYNHDPSNAAALVFSYSYDAALLSQTLDIAIDETIDTDYTSPTSVTIDALINENGAGITQVDFYIDGSWQATDTTAPFNFTNLYGTGSHFVEAVATDGCLFDTSAITINVGAVAKTDSVTINSGLDDVEETEAGRVYVNSSDLEMVNDNGNSIFDGTPNGNQKIGLRFNRVI